MTQDGWANDVCVLTAMNPLHGSCSLARAGKRCGAQLSVTCLMVLALMPVGAAAILPANRVIDWAPGVPGGIPNREEIFARVTDAPYNAAGDGVADDTNALKQAIAACPPGKVVYIPEGSYLVTDRLYFPQGRNQITIRGAGPGKTVLNFTGPNYGFYFGSKSFGPVLKITSGLDKGSTQCGVASAPDSSFAPGRLMLINQLNDGALVDPTNQHNVPVTFADRDRNGTRNLQQLVRITQVTPTSVAFTPPLYHELSAGLNPEVCSLKGTLEGIGLEDLQINDANGTMAYYGIWFINAQKCWVRNVKTSNIKGWHQFWYFGLENEVRGCEFAGSGPGAGAGNGYGFEARNQSAMLIEDNLIHETQWPFLLNSGSNGCVAAYNFFHHNYNRQDPGFLNPIVQANHGAHPMLNLYEGNIAGKFHANSYHGSCSHMVLLRNIFKGTDEGVTKNHMAVALDAQTTNHALVGNVLGNPGVAWKFHSRNGEDFGYGDPVILRLGYQNMGNNTATDHDRRTKDTTIVHGNHDYFNKRVVWDPAIADRVLPDSLYLPAKPGWFGELAWPPVDPAKPVPDDPTIIPAGYRFVHGTNPPGVAGMGLNPPLAFSQNLTIAKDQATPFKLRASDADGDPLSYTIVAGPAQGLLSGTPPDMAYSPAPGFVGTDAMSFSVRDGKFTSNVATIRFTVSEAGAVLGASFGAGDGQISAPFELAGGVVSQAVVTTQPDRGGRAAYRFTVGEAGDYVVSMEVDAPDDGADSLFVNVDGEPTTPRMIWAIRPWTDGFQRLTVSWLGEGTTTQPEFRPARFGLSAGEHTLVIRGREAGVRFRSIVITPFVPPDEPAYKEGTPKPTGDAPYVPREKTGE